MKLLIKFPSRNRAEKFRSTFDNYYQKLSGKHEVRFIISADLDDHSMNNDAIQSFLNRPFVDIKYGNSKSKVEAINNNMDTNFEALLLVSDDMIPQVDHYDDIICQNMVKYFPNLDGCLHFDDGNKTKLNTLSIMGVNLYKRMGYIYHPDYISLWCDNEYQDVTEGWGKAIYVDEVIIKHEWVNYTGKDSLHIRNESFYNKDKMTYLKRKSLNFPKTSVFN